MPNLIPFGVATSVVIAGLAIATLILLHRLRIRPTIRPTATLLFWSTARVQSTARVIARVRFVHWKTFVLLASLLLLLAAVPALLCRPAVPEDVVVIEAGADAASSTESGETVWTAAIDLATEDAVGRGTSPAWVVANDVPRVVARAGTPVQVVARQIATFSPDAKAADPTTALQLAAQIAGEGSRIFWYTCHPNLPDGLPPATAERIVIRTVPAKSNDVSIVSAIYSAADNAMFVRLNGRTATSVAGHLLIDGRSGSAFDFVPPVTNVRVDNLPADGKLVSISLTGCPGSPLRQSTAIRVAREIPLRFNLAADVPRPLRDVLLSIGQADTSAGAIAVGRNDERVGPRILLIDSVERVGGTLRSSVEDLSMENTALPVIATLPASGSVLLWAGDAPAMTLSADGRILYAARQAVIESSDLVRCAAFPTLMKIACDRLASNASAPPVITAERAAADPVWAISAGNVYAASTAVAEVPRNDVVISSIYHPNWPVLLFEAAGILLAIQAMLWATGKVV